MNRLELILVSLLGALVAGPCGAQSAWLSEDVRQGVTAQLAQKLMDTPLAQENSNDEIVAGALSVVDGIASQLDGWGEQALIDKAPRLSELKVPTLGDVRADAMLRYGLCSTFMDAVHENRELDSSQPRMRAAAAVNGTAVILVSLYLRRAFVDAGGTDEQLKGLFYDSPWELQADQQSMGLIGSACLPVLSAIADF